MKYIEWLSEISLTFIKIDDFDNQMNSALQIIGTYLDISRVYVFMDNESGTATCNTYEWCNTGIKPQIDKLQNIPYPAIPSWRSILEKEGRIYSEKMNELPPDLVDILAPQNILSIVVYPLIVEQKMSGFIGLDECVRPRQWTDTELGMLKTISGIISSSMERNLFQTRLRQSKNNFRSFFDTIDDLFIIGRMNGDVIYANKAASRKLGYTYQELQTKKIIDLHPVDKRDQALEIFTAMINGQRTSCPLELLDKNGNTIPVETRIWLGKWNGEDCIFGISKDLSKEQEALAMFTKLFQNNPALMAISNVSDDRITDVNLSFLNKLGYKRNEIIGKTIDVLNILPDPTTLNEVRDKIIKTGKVMELELLVKCKNGRMMTGLFSGEIIDNFGVKSFLSVMVDITEQVNLRLEVEKHRNRLNNIIEGTHLGTWEWNIKTGQTILNDRWAQIAGYTLAELQPVNFETWTKLSNPDDLRKSNQLLQKHFRGETEYYEFESRIKHKDGHWVWVLDRGKVIEWDDGGSPVRMFGTHADITYQKMIEQDLKESEKRYNLAFEGANAGLWDWDMVHDKVYFSPLWKSMLGYEDREVENSFNGWKKLWHPDDVSVIEKAMSDYLEGRVSSYEVIHRLRHKNGEWRWILTRGGILQDESGQPYRWIGTNMDITDEKERSNELERFFSVNLDLLCIADTEGNFIKTNKAWEEILGYSSNELENRKFLEFIHPDDLASTYQAIAKLEGQEKVIDFVNRYKCKDGTYRFIEWRSHPYGNLIYAAARDITERVVYEQKIEDLSIHDPLTGIYNRRYIFERFDEIISEFSRTGKVFSVSMLDIDFFKKINDEFGHLAGDYLLKSFAAIISTNLRPYDLFGRYGGEEFIIISLNSTRHQTIGTISRILDMIRQKVFEFNNSEIRFTFSAGISDSQEYPRNRLTPEMIIDTADSRLYLAKESGRNRIVVSDSALADEAQ